MSVPRLVDRLVDEVKKCDRGDATSRIRDLLGAGANPDARTESGISVLAVAIRLECYGVFEELLRYGAHATVEELNDAIANDSYIMTHMLLENGVSTIDVDFKELVEENSEEVIALVLDHSIDIDMEFDELLFTAIRRGEENIVKLILDYGADVNADDPMGGRRTPLSLAASRGNKEIVRLLLERGADVHEKTLEVAILRGRVEVAHILIEAGADVERADTGADSSLASIALERVKNKEDAKELFYLLINRGAEVNQKTLAAALKEEYFDIANWLVDEKGVDADDETLVNTVVTWGVVDSVKWLINRGVNLNVEGGEGSPITIDILEMGTGKGAASVPYREIAVLMLDEGVELGEEEGKEFLVVYATEGRNNVVEALLRRGFRSEEAIFEAVLNGHFLIVELLNEYGVELPADRVNELLETAVKENNYEMAEWLLTEKEADPNVQEGIILSKAAKSTRPEMVELLLDNGATRGIRHALEVAFKEYQESASESPRRGRLSDIIEKLKTALGKGKMGLHSADICESDELTPAHRRWLENYVKTVYNEDINLENKSDQELCWIANVERERCGDQVDFNTLDPFSEMKDYHVVSLKLPDITTVHCYVRQELIRALREWGRLPLTNHKITPGSIVKLMYSPTTTFAVEPSVEGKYELIPVVESVQVADPEGTGVVTVNTGDRVIFGDMRAEVAQIFIHSYKYFILLQSLDDPDDGFEGSLEEFEEEFEGKITEDISEESSVAST